MPSDSAMPARGERARVLTIAADRPFVDALAHGLLAEAAHDPTGLALGRMLVLLPTRRACRALQDAFLRATGGRPLLLPRLQPIGDVEDDDLAFADAADGAADGAGDGFGDAATAEVPPAIGDLRRRLLLARLIRAQAGDARSAGGPSPDQAVRLAGELARLIDQVQTERLDFARLEKLVPEEFATHWQVTLDFLKIVTAHWPAILDEQAVLDPSERRNRMIAVRIAAWRADPPHDPVIAAGSTGSIPATADLLALVARLPNGRVVLPGLDRDLDEASWGAVGQTHPQYGLKQLLAGMGVDRDAVADWPDAAGDRRGSDRLALIADALRPAQTTDIWANAATVPSAPAGITRIDAADSHEEAGTIALIMRQVLEHDQGDERLRTAALVTPDRSLARGVAAALRRWDIVVDDSAGVPLGETPPGVFMRLAAAMLAARLAPVPLLAALKHPLAAGGMEIGRFRTLVRLLETDVLRGPRPAAGFAGLLAAAQAGDHAGALAPWLSMLAGHAQEFASLIDAASQSLPALAAAHARFAEALAATADEAGTARLWRGDAGEGLAAFVAELVEGGDDLGPVDGARYAALFDELLAGRVVRPRFGAHPRLAILGPLEARLQRFDVMILGGLNEGTWPADPVADPWMSRPMRARFGLPAPERRIGQSAHDFAQAFCAETVFLTRALRVDGTPTVPSRWLTRLEYLTGGPDSGAAFSSRAAAAVDWLAWQRALDTPSAEDRFAAGPVRPAPTPPVEARPTKLSVTQVETWMRDPYAIYARHILGLRALDALDAAPDAADYGSRIHAVLDAFVRDHDRGDLPADAAEQLIARGAEALGDLRARPAVWAFWWPRFQRVARWFAIQEAKRRAGLARAIAEVDGKLTIDAAGTSFTVTARADRVDRLADGTLAIVDYKTGAPPPKKEVEAGFAPQLPLEAAIARAGGFAGIAAGEVSALEYWRLNGGEPAGTVSHAGDDPAQLADAALLGLTGLVARFADPATGYESRPRADMAPAYSDYEHLARVLEWSTDSGAGGEDGS